MMSYANFLLSIWVSFALLRFIIRKYRKHQQWKVIRTLKVITFTSKLKFTYNEVLTLMTGKDMEEDFIGRGGSGSVFHGNLGGQKVAVKKFWMTEENNLVKVFEAEVTTLGALCHSNIITLLICISNSDMMVLVYEYMENGSLDQWLHTGKGCLGWRTRLSIATDVANGLSYMHHTFILPVIHRDIKSSNILLDTLFRAKIGDFGLARILSKLGESELVSDLCGTFGYIAPEYARNGTVSVKVDVFSFGVLLLELVTGKQPHDAGREQGVSLVEWAKQQYRNKARWDHIIDKDIQNPAYEDDMKAVFMLGLSCTSEDPLNRPAMNEVVEQLLSCDPSRVKHRGSFAAKVYRKIRDKIFRQD